MKMKKFYREMLGLREFDQMICKVREGFNSILEPIKLRYPIEGQSINTSIQTDGIDYNQLMVQNLS